MAEKEGKVKGVDDLGSPDPDRVGCPGVVDGGRDDVNTAGLGEARNASPLATDEQAAEASATRATVAIRLDSDTRRSMESVPYAELGRPAVAGATHAECMGPWVGRGTIAEKYGPMTTTR